MGANLKVNYSNTVSVHGAFPHLLATVEAIFLMLLCWRHAASAANYYGPRWSDECRSGLVLLRSGNLMSLPAVSLVRHVAEISVLG